MNKNINFTYLDIALDAAVKAGAEILKVYGSDDFDVERKEDNSPLTRADRRSHDVIEDQLRRTGIPVLSEEGVEIPYQERSGWERYWLVDPLDGTKEFIKRNGEFTVNIALMVRNHTGTGPQNQIGDQSVNRTEQKSVNRASDCREDRGVDPGEDRCKDRTAEQPSYEIRSQAAYFPVAGIVYVPVKDLLYFGYTSAGERKAWKLARAAELGMVSCEQIAAHGRSLGAVVDGEYPMTAIVSRSHNTSESEELLTRLETAYGDVRRISSGSSIKLCLVAEGAADIYPRFAPTMEWDTAAGDAVCRAAGCRVTEKNAVTPLNYNKKDLHNPWFLVMGPRIDSSVAAGENREDGGSDIGIDKEKGSWLDDRADKSTNRKSGDIR